MCTHRFWRRFTLNSLFFDKSLFPSSSFVGKFENLHHSFEILTRFPVNYSRKRNWIEKYVWNMPKILVDFFWNCRNISFKSFSNWMEINIFTLQTREIYQYHIFFNYKPNSFIQSVNKYVIMYKLFCNFVSSPCY